MYSGYVVLQRSAITFSAKNSRLQAHSPPTKQTYFVLYNFYTNIEIPNTFNNGHAQTNRLSTNDKKKRNLL